METYGASTESAFPEADVDKALNPALNRKFEVDPVSSDISTTKEIQQVLLHSIQPVHTHYTQYSRKKGINQLEIIYYLIFFMLSSDIEN
jgi:hypothetical protein